MIFSSDRDYTLWPPRHRLTVDLDSTSIDLLIVGGSEAWTKSTHYLSLLLRHANPQFPRLRFGERAK
jgi:hypothetical protein